MKTNHRSFAVVAGMAALLLAGVAGVTQSRTKKQPYTIQLDDVSDGFTVSASMKDEKNSADRSREFFDYKMKLANGGEIVVKHARISTSKNGQRLYVQLLP